MSEDIDTTFENEEPTQDELTVLKERAKQLGLTFHPNIGLDTLRERVNAAIQGQKENLEKEGENCTPEEAIPVKESRNEYRKRKRLEAAELVRIRVTCMNPHKSAYEGEIFTAGNAVVGTFRKYVAFNVEWHVPRIIYLFMTNKEFQHFYTTKDSKGRKVQRGKLVKEFAIEVLPPLTPDELKDLAQRQAMASGTAPGQ